MARRLQGSSVFRSRPVARSRAVPLDEAAYSHLEHAGRRGWSSLQRGLLRQEMRLDVNGFTIQLSASRPRRYRSGQRVTSSSAPVMATWTALDTIVVRSYYQSLRSGQVGVAVFAAAIDKEPETWATAKAAGVCIGRDNHSDLGAPNPESCPNRASSLI
ncbi:hypothetical protein EJ04DRAFT_224074 [Polyplosphaeria fusca]|uniref:Uncharacterized protein n=1 Tax=Polyplosphaeria fusca TaxID=682080 RepID=A0A9P4QY58_9PLEO|nr:hypothetical protein EJ04DRAFT_224074 [Polyplosphaeria fusca]